MKSLRAAILFLIITVFLAGAVWAQEKPPAEPGSIQKTCFIMKGNPINPKIYADYKGHRIYFCCTHCVQAFKENPEKYFQEMIKAGTPLERTPETKK